MVVKVLSRLGQAFSHSLDGLSLAQDSMLLRLRRASLALLALIGAVGLGLVIFISQLGWPAVLSGPLPIGPAKVGTVHDGVALTRKAPRGAPVAGKQNGAVAAGEAEGTSRRASRDSDESGESRLGGSRELANAPAAEQPGTGAVQPPSSVSPPAPPAAAPTPTVSVPAPASPTTASVEGAPAAGAVKASNDSKKAAGLAGAKSPGQQTAASKDPSSSSSKSSELAGVKAHRDESTAAPAAPASGAPPPSSPAAAKEAADAARASQGSH